MHLNDERDGGETLRSVSVYRHAKPLSACRAVKRYGVATALVLPSEMALRSTFP